MTDRTPGFTSLPHQHSSKMIIKWRQQGATKIKGKRGGQHEADAIRCVEAWKVEGPGCSRGGGTDIPGPDTTAMRVEGLEVGGMPV